MPYLLFLKKQRLKLSSAANYRWRLKGLKARIGYLYRLMATTEGSPGRQNISRMPLNGKIFFAHTQLTNISH